MNGVANLIVTKALLVTSSLHCC